MTLGVGGADLPHILEVKWFLRTIWIAVREVDAGEQDGGGRLRVSVLTWTVSFGRMIAVGAMFTLLSRRNFKYAVCGDYIPLIYLDSNWLDLQSRALILAFS